MVKKHWRKVKNLGYFYGAYCGVWDSPDRDGFWADYSTPTEEICQACARLKEKEEGK